MAENLLVGERPSSSSYQTGSASPAGRGPRQHPGGVGGRVGVDDGCRSRRPRAGSPRSDPPEQRYVVPEADQRVAATRSPPLLPKGSSWWRARSRGRPGSSSARSRRPRWWSIEAIVTARSATSAAASCGWWRRGSRRWGGADPGDRHVAGAGGRSSRRTSRSPRRRRAASARAPIERGPRQATTWSRRGFSMPIEITESPDGVGTGMICPRPGSAGSRRCRAWRGSSARRCRRRRCRRRPALAMASARLTVTDDLPRRPCRWRSRTPWSTSPAGRTGSLGRRAAQVGWSSARCSGHRARVSRPR